MLSKGKFETPPYSNTKQDTIIFRKFLILMFFTCLPDRTDLCSNHLALPTDEIKTQSDSSNIPTSLLALSLDGHLSFENNHHAAKDFGNRYRLAPSAVLHPKSVSDISSTIRHIFQLGSSSELTVAGRGHGHSLHGQAQAHRGVVINMRSLQQPKMKVVIGEKPYVDVSGGELWINILHETLKYGLAPKSWTDYLHLTVGGTLSNAGISGQAFRHGPQIDNVYQMEVVTGKGDSIICSRKQNSDIFYGVLGGLGQFGIITRARISLEQAPRKVKWIRMLYSDFYKFSKDQEHLISSEQSFDYIEGFVIINRTGLVNNWRSSFNPRDPIEASKFKSDDKTLYCLEVAKYFYTNDDDNVYQNIDSLLSELSYIRSTLFLTETSYIDFLDRVHISEIKLRKKDLWDVLHPWLILLIPKSSIHDFAKEVFGNILTDTSNGPILIYPVDKSKWNNKTSLVTPEEDIIFNVGFLSSAIPSSKGRDGLDHILAQNRRILDFCENAQLGIKQYLPHYNTQEEWKAHFGSRWENFVRRKHVYDPLAILAPGHRIFPRQRPYGEAGSNDKPCNNLLSSA